MAEARSMFCPLCGADSQRANSYCKRCGEWLPDIKARTRSGFGGQTPQQNILTNLFMSALTTLAALISAIALYATYLGTGDAKWSVYLAAGVCLCIAGWQTSSFFVALKLRRRLKKGREESIEVEQLTERRSASVLNPANPDAFVGAPSVTEDTTRVLDPVLSRERDTQR